MAYILAGDPNDPDGESFNDGEYSPYLNVTDNDILTEENVNPVVTLGMRYDAWKAERGISSCLDGRRRRHTRDSVAVTRAQETQL